MNVKVWNDLKSRRDLEHRTARTEHKRAQVRELKARPKGIVRVNPIYKPIEVIDRKPMKVGIVKKIWHRLIGK